MELRKSRQYQTIFDVALQHYGDLDGGLAALIADNPDCLQGGLFPIGVYDWKVNRFLKPNQRISDRMKQIVPVSGEVEYDTFIWQTEVELGVTNGEFWQTEIEDGVTNGEFWSN